MDIYIASCVKEIGIGLKGNGILIGPIMHIIAIHIDSFVKLDSFIGRNSFKKIIY